MKINKIK